LSESVVVFTYLDSLLLPTACRTLSATGL